MKESEESQRDQHAAGAPVIKRRLLRLWMVDDHASFREGFAQLLSARPDLRVTRQFPSVQPMLTALAEERPPDIVLLDLNIGKENGVSAIGPIRKLAPGVKVLMLTTFNNTYSEAEAFRSGASGFLLKIYELNEIIELIYQSFYHPEDPRLFPNVARNSSVQGATDSKTTKTNDQRPGFFRALRELYRPRRKQEV